MLGELAHVLRVVAVGEDASVDHRVQRLHTAVEHLWKASDCFNERDGDAGVDQMLCRTAS